MAAAACAAPTRLRALRAAAERHRDEEGARHDEDAEPAGEAREDEDDGEAADEGGEAEPHERQEAGHVGGPHEVLAEQRLLGAVRADAGAEPARLEGHQLHRGRRRAQDRLVARDVQALRLAPLLEQQAGTEAAGKGEAAPERLVGRDGLDGAFKEQRPRHRVAEAGDDQQRTALVEAAAREWVQHAREDLRLARLGARQLRLPQLDRDTVQRIRPHSARRGGQVLLVQRLGPASVRDGRAPAEPEAREQAGVVGRAAAGGHRRVVDRPSQKQWAGLGCFALANHAFVRPQVRPPHHG